MAVLGAGAAFPGPNAVRGVQRQQYELSSRAGRIMVRVGRLTVPLDGKLRTQLHLPTNVSVDDIPKLNMRLRTERTGRRWPRCYAVLQVGDVQKA